MTCAPSSLPNARQPGEGTSRNRPPQRPQPPPDPSHKSRKQILTKQKTNQAIPFIAYCIPTMSRSIRSVGILAGLLAILYIGASQTGPRGTRALAPRPPSESYVDSISNPGLIMLSEAQPRPMKNSGGTSITTNSPNSTISRRDENDLGSAPTL